MALAWFDSGTKNIEGITTPATIKRVDMEYPFDICVDAFSTDTRHNMSGIDYAESPLYGGLGHRHFSDTAYYSGNVGEIEFPHNVEPILRGLDDAPK